MTRRHPTIGRRLAGTSASLGVVLALAAGLAACGSDDGDSGAAATTAASTSGTTDEDAETGSSYAIVPDAEVASGLASTITKLTSLSAAPATATEDAVKEVFEGWEEYEGTVKQNDVDTYLSLEDALGAFKKGAEAGDQAAMAAALADFTTASSAYLTSHPG